MRNVLESTIACLATFVWYFLLGTYLLPELFGLGDWLRAGPFVVMYTGFTLVLTAIAMDAYDTLRYAYWEYEAWNE